VIPDCVHREINNARTGVWHAAKRAREANARRTRAQPVEPPARRPAPQPAWQVATGPAARPPSAASNRERRRKPRPLSTAKPDDLACKTCGLWLDPILARTGRHIGC
jgi:hypothetical protein